MYCHELFNKARKLTEKQIKYFQHSFHTFFVFKKTLLYSYKKTLSNNKKSNFQTSK